MNGANSIGRGVLQAYPQVADQNRESKVNGSKTCFIAESISGGDTKSQELASSIEAFVVSRCYGLNKKQIRDDVSGVWNLQISHSVMYKAIHDFLVTIFEKNNKDPLSIKLIAQAIDFATENFKASFKMAPNSNEVANELADELKFFAKRYKEIISDILDDKPQLSSNKEMLLNKMLKMKCQASILKISNVINANYKHISADTRIIRHAIFRVFVSAQKENFTQKQLEQVEQSEEKIIKDKQTYESFTKKDLDKLIKVLARECSYEIFSLFKREAKFNGAAVAMNAKYFEPILKQFDNIEGYIEKFIRIEQKRIDKEIKQEINGQEVNEQARLKRTMPVLESDSRSVILNSMLNLIEYINPNLSEITDDSINQKILEAFKANYSTHGFSDSELLSICSNFRKYLNELTQYFKVNKKKTITLGELKGAMINYKNNFNLELIKKEVVSFMHSFDFKQCKLDQYSLCKAIIMTLLLKLSECKEDIIQTNFETTLNSDKYLAISTVFWKFHNQIVEHGDFNEVRALLLIDTSGIINSQNQGGIYFNKRVTENAEKLFAEIKEIVKDFYFNHP